jgi:hypothetical protein
MGMQAFKLIGHLTTWLRVIGFLASDDARSITGDIVAADGGSRM